MMQSDRSLAHFSRALHDIALSAIILAIVLPFRQLECVLDIQDSGWHSFSENMKCMLKNQHFCVFIEGDGYMTGTHTDVQLNLETFGRTLESNVYLQSSP